MTGNAVIVGLASGVASPLLALLLRYTPSISVFLARERSTPQFVPRFLPFLLFFRSETCVSVLLCVRVCVELKAARNVKFNFCTLIQFHTCISSSPCAVDSSPFSVDAGYHCCIFRAITRTKYYVIILVTHGDLPCLVPGTRDYKDAMLSYQ